jgi:hypothetical protein
MMLLGKTAEYGRPSGMLGADPAAVVQLGRWFSAKALVRVPAKGDSEEKSAKG